jgi:two-component system response regulator NreC
MGPAILVTKRIFPEAVELLKRHAEVDYADSDDGLTEREHEVLTYLAEGANNDKIAEALVISPKTVERHRENIMRKLNMHSRAELVRYAIRKGIIKA